MRFIFTLLDSIAPELTNAWRKVGISGVLVMIGLGVFAYTSSNTKEKINSGSQNGSNTQRENVKEGDSKFGDTTHKIEKTTNGDLENQE